MDHVCPVVTNVNTTSFLWKLAAPQGRHTLIGHTNNYVLISQIVTRVAALWMFEGGKNMSSVCLHLQTKALAFGASNTAEESISQEGLLLG